MLEGSSLTDDSLKNYCKNILNELGKTEGAEDGNAGAEAGASCTKTAVASDLPIDDLKELNRDA